MSEGERVSSKDVLEAAECSASTLARWVSFGLLPPCVKVGSERGGMSGFFPAGTIERVKEIRAARGRGFTLAEIKKQLDKGRRGRGRPR